MAAGLRALGDDDVGAGLQRDAASPAVWTWQMSGTPAARIAGANGRGSPNESMSARGPFASTRSRTPGFSASAQVIRPQPTAASPASANCASIQSASP